MARAGAGPRRRNGARSPQHHLGQLRGHRRAGAIGRKGDRKNHLRARYCNQCGAKLDEDRATGDADGRAKLHADIAHPINSACREVIQTAVLKAYQEERERAKQAGYVSNYDDFEGDYKGSQATAQIPR